MAFKSAAQFNEEKYMGKFILPDNGDFADVIFLYESYNDVLLADVHYVKSADYSGYVQCIGRSCPVCAKKIKVQNKLFIPLIKLNRDAGLPDEFLFWDRGSAFEKQLLRDVFKKCSNPSNYVFRITRNGIAGDINTTYQIDLLSKAPMTYSEILEKFDIKFPDAYEQICKDMSSEELSNLFANSETNSIDDDLPDYSVTPRISSTAVETPVYDPVSADADINVGDDIVDGDVDDVSF